jgi:hypothetical protein
MSATNHAQIAAAQAPDGRSAAELIAAYRDGSGMLRRSVKGMSRGQLLAKPIEGKMSSLEVLCHVADCEQFLADRMKRVVAMERPLLVGADGWLYIDALHYHDRDVELQLALVEATRAQMAADLDALAPEAWERVGVHTETGLVTLKGLLAHAIRHLEAHVEAIAEKRAALGF